jgi:tetratricopeptide (TPR) repeat protein
MLRGVRQALAAGVLFVAPFALVARAAAEVDPIAVAKADWHEVATRHFTILTDAPEGIAMGAGRRLEDFCEMLHTLHPGLRNIPALPTVIYVFRDRAEMATFSPTTLENVAGFSTVGPGRNLFVMNAEVEGTDRASVVCHEFTHVFLNSNFSEMPVWMNEGLAQYYQTFRLRGRRAEFAHAIEGPPEWLESHAWADFDLLFAMNTAARAYQRDNELRSTMYAQGWATIHYLGADPARAARLDSVLVAMRHGTPARMAFRAQYPVDQWPQLIEAVKRHVHDGAFDARAVSLSAATEAAGPRERTLSAPEATQWLGDLMLSLGPGRQPGAVALFRSAVEGDPSLARAQASLGYLADRASDTLKAEAAYSAAERLAPRDARVALLTGLGRLQRAVLLGDSSADPGDIERCLALARRDLQRCIGSEPDNPEALGALGLTVTWLGEASEDAIRDLTAAVDALPAYPQYRAALKAAREMQARVPASPAKSEH